MRPRHAPRFAWIAITGIAFASRVGADDAERGPVPAKECVKTRTEARYRGYGYDHLVHVTNGCDKVQRCSVSTNVNPDATTVTVAQGKAETVVTMRGSPAREFEARVSCEPAG